MKTLCPNGLYNAGGLVCGSVATVAAGLPCFTSFLPEYDPHRVALDCPEGKL